MATRNDIPELLRRGIEAARDGKKAEARSLFEQVTELDENNEKGWFWLASVVDTDEERRICLSNVLHINPNNEKAQRAMAALEEKLKNKKRLQDNNEVIAGVSRKQFNFILGGGILLVLVILIIGLVVIVSNNNRIAAENATSTAVAVAATGTSDAIAAAAATATQAQVAFAATQTALVPTVIPITPTARIPTLPATWTPTPSNTPEITATSLPPPLELSGRLVVWSGRDELNTGYLPIGYFNLDFGNQYTRIGNEYGKFVSITGNGQRVLYERYDDLLFSSVIEAVNLNGTEQQNLAEFYSGSGITLVQPKQPNIGAFGQRIAFVAKTAQRNYFQIFVVEIGEVPEGVPRVKQLTDDDIDYSFPVFSPDGTRIAAVRTDVNTAIPSVDLVNVDVATGGKFLISSDFEATIETHPRWTHDGQQIIYAAAPSNDPNNHDILLRNANGAGTPLPLYRSPFDDIYPVMSPDQRHIAFASDRGSGYDIYVYEQANQALFQLTNNPADDFPGDWWQP
ncbi:MAG: PD40 domain-containing protein [Chloroflexi bacterium]|nr:PD40 domain-containing protein [Chloroflexota bacterium]